MFSSYSELATDVAAYAIFALIAFVVLFALILAVIAKGDSSLAVRGLFALLGSFFGAPFHYLRSVVRTLIGHGSTSDSEQTESKQYLLQKLILLSNAGLLLTTVAILAAGVVMSWIALAPPEQRAQKRILSAQIEEIEKGIETRQTEVAKAKSDSDPAKGSARIAQIDQNIAKLNADMDSARTRTAGIAASVPALNMIDNYTGKQAAQSQTQIDNMFREITTYINANVSDEAAKQALQTYASAWQQLAIAKIDGDAFRRTMQEGKARIDAAELEISAETERLQQIKAQRSEMGLFLTAENVWASIKSLLGTFFMAFCWVWILGVAIESAGLFIDMAENVRRTRASSERQPQPELALT